MNTDNGGKTDAVVKADGGFNVSTDALVGAVATNIFVADENLVVQHISEEMLKVLGYSRNEVVGKMTCAELCNTPLCGGPDCVLKKCWATHQTVVGETVAQTRSGEEIPIATYCSGLFDDEGKPIGGIEVVMDNTHALALAAAMEQINGLNRAAEEGDFSARADLDAIPSEELRGLFEGFNAMMEALAHPIRVATDYISRIGNGDIPEPITEEYQGDFNQIKDSLNRCIAAINALVEDANGLTDAAMAGKLDTRVDESKHFGDFQLIVRGLNQTLDAVVNPLNEATEVLAAAARRDLTKRLEADYQGDLGKLKTNINETLNVIDEALGQVAMAIVQVAEASDQISSGSQALAEVAAEQASALEEVASSIEEMSAMTQQNAGNATEARSLADEARDNAEKGEEAMARMSQAMDEIQTSSNETAKIVNTIDEIAFQTNLLALNAAVEAARAGDARKGLAVVAEELRNLAQRAAEAAKDTADMIEEAVKNAEGGVSICQEVAEALAVISQGSAKVNELVAEIAAASDEQAQGIEQINTAVGEMDTATQTNAATSEESASAAEELASQAQELRAMIEAFKLTSARGRDGTVSLKLVKDDEKPRERRKGSTAEQQIPLDDDDEALLANF